jgi:cysteine-rich repeat protein
MTSMNSPRASAIALALFAGFAFFTPALVATDASAQLVTQEDRCQADLAKTARRYLERVLKYRIRCQNNVITGDLPLATDCLFGTGDERLEKQLLKAQARLSVSGSACNGVSLQLLGFPNMCDDDTGFPFDTSDFKQCVLERTDAILDQLLDYYYPPLFERQRDDIALCLQGTPQDAMDSLIGKVRAREKCLVGQAYGKIDEEDVDCYQKILPYGPGTGDGRTDDSLEGAYSELLANVPKACAIVNINDLGYQDKCTDPTGGVFNIYDLKSCLFDADRVAALEVLGTVFPVDGICGDGILQGEEECDEGIDDNSDFIPNRCRTDCTNPVCGDGVTDPLFAEACDDQNTVDDDCCRNNCQAAVCGDGVRTCTEECDDGAANSDTEADACRTSCMDADCGDGTIDTGEECDDDNETDEDGCSRLCFDEFCGDEIIQEGLGEECDNGFDNGTGPDECRPAGHPFECQNAQCGDGIVDSKEECDDGNSVEDDECDSQCKDVGFCGDGERNSGEECDGSDLDCPGGVCRTDGSCTCNTVCPTEGELVLYAGLGKECSTNAECDVGHCSQEFGRCQTVTRLDSGWIGLAHNADINDEVVTRGFLECTDSHSAPCGVCDVTGIDPQTRSCRCANDTRRICNDPFNANAPECGSCAGGDLNGRACGANADCASTCARRCSLEASRTCTSNADCLPSLSFGTCGAATTCNDATGCSTNGDCASGTCTGTPAACQCYFGAPFPLSSGGTPACVLNRFSQDVSGTANVDLGAGAITAKLRTQVHLGISTRTPCPVCGGICSNSATTWCGRDEDCPAGGTCNDDPLENDGVRGGTCSNYNGSDSLKPCDKSAFNSSFPAFVTADPPNGGWYSLDCLPNVNVSGQGLIINLTQTTGPVSLEAQVPCPGSGSAFDCPCLVCSSDGSVPCSTDGDCAGLASRCTLSTSTQNPVTCNANADCQSIDAGPCNSSTTGRCSRVFSVMCTSNADCQNKPAGTCPPPICSSAGTGLAPLPNNCENFDCTDLGDGLSECTTGPDTTYCAGIVKANGGGLLTCGNDDACSPGNVGIDARPCGLVERSGCFLDPITATGVADPETPIGAAVFCIPPTTNGGINSAAGLPGPGRVVNQAKARTFCGNDTSQQYIPGVGGCDD